jgi:hypothetical protein
MPGTKSLTVGPAKKATEEIMTALYYNFSIDKNAVLTEEFEKEVRSAVRRAMSKAALRAHRE